MRRTKVPFHDGRKGRRTALNGRCRCGAHRWDWAHNACEPSLINSIPTKLVVSAIPILLFQPLADEARVLAKLLLHAGGKPRRQRVAPDGWVDDLVTEAGLCCSKKRSYFILTIEQRGTPPHTFAAARCRGILTISCPNFFVQNPMQNSVTTGLASSECIRNGAFCVAHRHEGHFHSLAPAIGTRKSPARKITGPLGGVRGGLEVLL